jgi:hypothetical protein
MLRPRAVRNIQMSMEVKGEAAESKDILSKCIECKVSLTCEDRHSSDKHQTQVFAYTRP